MAQAASGPETNPEAGDYEEIMGEIVRTDRQQNDLKTELSDLEDLVKVSHSQATLEAEIRELKSKLANQK